MAARVNKRRYVRTKAQNLVAHLRVGDRSIQAPVDDISMGGLLARTVESIPIGTAIMFDLARPGLKKPLRLLGVVVDTRVGRGLGIRFDGLDKETSDRLSDLISDLGGMTTPTNLLADPEPLPRTSSASALPAAPAPAPSSTSYRMATAAAPEPPPAPRPPSGPSENELKLQAQVRSMVMELGRLQELVAQREKELHDARTEIARLQSEANAGDAAQRIVGRLEIEKGRLESELAETRARAQRDVDFARREAEQAVAALARVVDALQRLGR